MATPSAGPRLRSGVGVEAAPSAQTLVDKAAILSHLLDADTAKPTIAAIHIPLLAFFGSSERGVEATLAAIRRQAKGVARVDTRTIEGADHFYGSHEPEVAQVIAQWIDAVITLPQSEHPGP